MTGNSRPWELTILDADPPMQDTASMAVGDIDADGRLEFVVGGGCVTPDGTLAWYRPSTGEKGVIATGHFQCGVALEDIDGDGKFEVITGHSVDSTDYAPGIWKINWFKPVGGLDGPWKQFTIDPKAVGLPHDVLFADIDGDGRRELIAAHVYVSNPGLYIYRPGTDVTQPWHRHEVQRGYFGDGTAAADVDGDGICEIVSGPSLWHSPEGGAFAGPWTKQNLAKSFREMGRAVFVDITGTGRPDVVITEAEYPHGKASWFENRVLEDPENPWIEHPMADELYYAHTLRAWQDVDGGTVRVLIAEMREGGWVKVPNRDARLIEYSTSDGGGTWNRELISVGSGTHEAVVVDIDGDGELEILGKQHKLPKVQLWDRAPEPSPLSHFHHLMIDRDKHNLATDIIAVDITGDGCDDVVCGSWWYQSPTWQRRVIPGVYQVINAYDIDGDGKKELIATKRNDAADSAYGRLTSELVWIKPVNPLNDTWKEYPIGTGCGDWPHGSAIAPVLPDGRSALMTTYHSGQQREDYPEIFEVPEDPTSGPWPKRVLAEIMYGEQLVPCDITGNGLWDIAAGEWWLENTGNGTFLPHRIAEGIMAARLAVMDITGDGTPDFILGEESLDFKNKVTPISRLIWLEHPQDPRGPWRQHVIDTLRCPHSISVADLDGDGELEIVCGEHDPFNRYRSRCRLLVYKKADPRGQTWKRYVLDDRFEHHDGAQTINLGGGRRGIISHGWKDSRYVHLWKPA